jgi:hypothetical protein
MLELEKMIPEVVSANAVVFSKQLRKSSFSAN